MRQIIILLCVASLILACDPPRRESTEKSTSTDQPALVAPKVETPAIEAPKVDSSMVKPVIPTTAMPGGYTKQDPESASIQDFAKKVMALLQKGEAGLELAKIHEAATQVVAGTNYFLRMELKNKSAKVELRDLIVYEDLQGNISITKMEIVK